MRKKQSSLEKVYRVLILVLPAVLYFSYYPVISFGADATMNFEISLSLVWLVVFAIVVLVLLMKQKKLNEIWKNWRWLLFPIFVTLSIIWSDNVMRGILTCGIMWLIYLSVLGFGVLRDLMTGEEFLRKFWRWFFGASLAICGWCAVQCVLDLIGAPRGCTLLCAGCTSWTFGFPHPNGLAIEPQFMGNLLLAPIVASMWLVFHSEKWKCYAGLFLIFVATLFLTFSRGAIYAFVVAMIFLSVFMLTRRKIAIFKKVGMVWGLVVVAFVLTLNMQGVMAQLSPTNDTYASGVAKVLNHLSLGIIDVRQNSGENEASESVVEDDGGGDNEAIFDGYVEESTNVRVEMTENAIRVWSQDFGTVMFGVGIGGAGQAMYDAGLTGSPKEIVQNEYANLLLEVGLLGVVLFGLTLVMIVKICTKNQNGILILTLMVAYGVTLCFFSGLPNALQVYLMPGIFYILLRKKLVS